MQRKGWFAGHGVPTFNTIVLNSQDGYDVHPKPMSEDASSQASDLFLIPHSPTAALKGPSRITMLQLCMARSSTGQQLLQATRAVACQLELATAGGTSSPEAKLLLDKLQEMHSCIVALDDQLDERELSADVQECREWLKQAQLYVLQLTRQVKASMTDSHHCETSSTSSMDESGSSNSSTAGTTAGDTAWRIWCQDAAEILSRVSQHMAAGGSTDSDSPHSVQSTCTTTGSRLVARQSRLSYAQYWSKKIAL